MLTAGGAERGNADRAALVEGSDAGGRVAERRDRIPGVGARTTLEIAPSATAGFAETPNAMPMPPASPPATCRICSPEEVTSVALANNAWCAAPSSCQVSVPLPDAPPPPSFAMLPPPEPQPAASANSPAATARHAATAAIEFELVLTSGSMPEGACARETKRPALLQRIRHAPAR